MTYKMLVIGLSAGGTPLIKRLLTALPKDYSLAVTIVAHLPEGHESTLAQQLNALTDLPVTEARDKEPIVAGHVYIAPPNYHLLIENNRTFSLSTEEKVNFSRPSIDILFESAANVYGPRLAAIILTGANNDGAEGLRLIKEKGGLAIVQDPRSAESSFMPGAALQAVQPDFVLGLAEIGRWLAESG